MRYLILSLLILAGVVAYAEETPDATRIREEEQRKIREANEANSPKNQGGRQVERTGNQNVGDAQRERQAIQTEYEARLRAQGRTPSATNETAVKRDAEMRERDAKQAETLRAREAQRPALTPKARTEYVERNVDQQNVNDVREKETLTADQKLKAEQARNGRTER